MRAGGRNRGRRERKAAGPAPAALEPEIVVDDEREDAEPAIAPDAVELPTIDEDALAAAARTHADDASPDGPEPRAAVRRRARGRGEADGEEGVEKDGALVSFDPLQRYLAEIRRHPLLTREEEHDLAVQFQHDRDIAAAYRLVTGNLRLVVMIAREYQRSFRNLLDLIQEGNIGLMEAVKNFDPYRGVRFPSYAVWWIRAYIIRYVMNNWRLVKLGTTQAQRKLFFNLQKEKDKLEAEGFVAGPKLLAQRLDVKEQEVVEMEQRLGGSDVSVDSPLHEGEDGTLLDVLKSGTATAEDQVADAEYRRRLSEKIREFGSTLHDKDRLIFDQRLLAEDPLTLQEIGDKYGISRERVRQVESRLKRRLKEYLARQFEDLRDVS
ncbi:MAG TPA: RNA polymerase factor sigma-32 [Candidatus Binatia bacterium]|jgi:RNA polymerase sigma-32 factor